MEPECLQSLRGCCMFATAAFMYLKAVLSCKTHPSVVTVRESPPEDNSITEDPGVSEGANSFIWAHKLVS